ncbi:hypothetical protein K502DRAFT_326338 [Neoconidiobolus thromboides FSU 785]|nr:hypothetical protein K502DRAFT_326338 [Neoconidiobolus thromboides FSU 785]
MSLSFHPSFITDTSSINNSGYFHSNDGMNLQSTQKAYSGFLLFCNERRPELLNINQELTESMQNKLLNQEWASMSEVNFNVLYKPNNCY